MKATNWFLQLEFDIDTKNSTRNNAKEIVITKISICKQGVQHIFPQNHFHKMNLAKLLGKNNTLYALPNEYKIFKESFLKDETPKDFDLTEINLDDFISMFVEI